MTDFPDSPWRGRQFDLSSMTTEGVRALHWGMRALSDARQRSVAAYGRSGQAHWATAVESVRWALALDEACDAQLPAAASYRKVREGDRDGQTVQGLRWLRNHHAHGLRVTGHGGPKKPFLGGGGGVIYLSPENRWLRADRIVDPVCDRSAGMRSAYEERVAGRPLDDPTGDAARGFGRVLSTLSARGVQQPCDEDPTVL